ncbi:hypothetical protein K9U39_19340 [Rhodoblastus acidophilus]|uniref:Uncharacterized protein n=1 Tax=Candidatus Rhodoblastus alkanivorans TaxID=2954117 RepID=A0ABS9Z3H0_9HYPH|nr:hypothetical protein [Candidatus Rhodoblastus alkanivorans]MCI4677276.1 hypothetical protein [Candidatus Rhodoblastus alkanivorans]MCI4682011.1 hypothetical protein [Candidatus Rhodoblastus alkanivorans]MDI4643062.1 hypothetical protein [Rhodoblastus acidophilus]
MAKKTKTPKNAAPARPKQRWASSLSLTMPLSRARKLAGDLYEAASLALWAEAIDGAAETKKADLVRLQDSICDAADFLREARATNPRHLQLFLVACFDRDGLPTTEPRFVTAASEAEAIAIWREAFKGEFGRKRPQARPAPALAAAPGLHD